MSRIPLCLVFLPPDDSGRIGQNQARRYFRRQAAIVLAY